MTTAFAIALISSGYATSLSVSVPTGTDRDFTDDEAKQARDNSIDEIIISGGGTITPSSASVLTGYKGKVTVREGYYKLTVVHAQPSTSVLVVESGATLWLCSTGAAFTLDCLLSFEGTGVGGTAGAIRLEGFTSQDCLITKSTMTGDALIYLNTSRPLRFNNDTGLDMGGHKLTVDAYSTAKGALVFYCPVINPGTVEMIKGTFRPGYGYRLTEGGTIILHDDAQIDLYKFGGHKGSLPDDFPWTVRPAWTKSPMAIMTPFKNNADSTNHILRCPIVFNGGYTNKLTGFLSGQNYYRRLSGDISGEGSIYLNDNGQYIHFAGANTMTGDIILNNGSCVLENPAAVPGGDYGRIVYSNADTAFLLARPKSDTIPNGYTAPDILNFLQTMQVTYGENARRYYVYPETVDQEVPGILEIDKTADTTGTVLRVFSGSVKFRTKFKNWPKFQMRNFYSASDRVILSAPEGESAGNVNSFNVLSGGLDLTDLGTVIVSNTCYVNGTASAPPRLRVGAGTAIVQANPAWTAGSDYGTFVQLGSSSRGRGIVEILSGGAMTNLVWPAAGVGSVGALYVRKGGVMFSTGHSGWDISFPQAESAEGYVEVDGGEYSTGTGHYLGANASASGVLYIKGGTFDVRGTWASTDAGPHIGREGTGVVYQCGGTLTSPGTLWIGSSNWRVPENLVRNGKSEYSIDGADAVARVGTATYLAAKSFAKCSLNLNNGGMLDTAMLMKPIVQPLQGNDNLIHVLSNRTAYVAFNGGVLRANANCEAWLGSTNVTASYTYYTDPSAKTGKVTASVSGSTCPDYVTVYEGGAILDSSNKSVTVQCPLVKPPATGGIASITIPGGATLTGYLAAPLVDISGDGEGASAVALFDSTNMMVTGVKVISPGWGYTAAKTKIVLRHGHKTVADPLVTNMTFAVANNAQTGGLTVRGSGTITLAAANTYGGDTTVAGGTLRVAHAAAIPSGSRILLGGGVLDMNGYALPEGCTVRLADLQRVVQGGKKVLLMSNVSGKITVENASDLPANWSVRQAGNNLWVGPVKGIVLLVN